MNAEVSIGTGMTEGQHAEVQFLEAAGIDYRFADNLTREVTAFDSFLELLDAKGGYVPSLNNRKPTHKSLADLYDSAQAFRNSPRRAFRN